MKSFHRPLSPFVPLFLAFQEISGFVVSISYTSFPFTVLAVGKRTDKSCRTRSPFTKGFPVQYCRVLILHGIQQQTDSNHQAIKSIIESTNCIFIFPFRIHLPNLMYISISFNLVKAKHFLFTQKEKGAHPCSVKPLSHIACLISISHLVISLRNIKPQIYFKLLIVSA